MYHAAENWKFQASSSELAYRLGQEKEARARNQIRLGLVVDSENQMNSWESNPSLCFTETSSFPRVPI